MDKRKSVPTGGQPPPSRHSAGKRGGGGKSPIRKIVISGELLKIFNRGVLIAGDSGIGKSECALELISRGHPFVSDDVVEVSLSPQGKLVGRPPSLSRDFMEIRGLGIINIRQIFGAKVISPFSRIDLVIQLMKWRRGFECDRLGLEFPEAAEFLGVKIPRLIVLVAPGRNIATLIEVASKVHILREKGYHGSRDIIKKLDKALL